MAKVTEVSELRHAIEDLLRMNGMLGRFYGTHNGEFRAKFKLLGFDPLLVEREDGKILITHLRRLGGGIIMEPAVLLTVDWFPLELVQQRDGIKWTVARRNGKAVTVLDPTMFATAKSFCKRWGENINMQGWADDAVVDDDVL